MVIINVPDPNDFKETGLELLNLGWGLVLELYRHLDDAQIVTWDDDGTIRDEFWRSAHRTLATVLTMTHQAGDMLIQARIAAVSPYLLVSGSVSQWPGGCAQKDTPFSSFRTHDSQDLPRVHDTLCEKRLSDDFKETLRKLRDYRNRTVHTVDKQLRISGVEVVRLILEIAHELLGSRRWVRERWTYLELYPLSVLHSPDHVGWVMNSEICTAVDMLGPAEVTKYFGFDKKQRRYHCDNCRMPAEFGDPEDTLVLRPNVPDSTVAWCFVCLTEVPVWRQNCVSAECQSNVIAVESGECLTCGVEQGEDADVV